MKPGKNHLNQTGPELKPSAVVSAINKMVTRKKYPEIQQLLKLQRCDALLNLWQCPSFGSGLSQKRRGKLKKINKFLRGGIFFRTNVVLRLKDSLGKLCGVIPVLRRIADEILGPFFSTKNIGSHMDCHRFFYIPFITAYQHTYVRMLPMHARTDRPRYLPIFLSACIHIFLHT